MMKLIRRAGVRGASGDHAERLAERRSTMQQWADYLEVLRNRSDWTDANPFDSLRFAPTP